MKEVMQIIGALIFGSVLIFGSCAVNFYSCREKFPDAAVWVCLIK